MRCQIYFLDLQVWYTVISALVGGLDGARIGLGEVSNDLVLRAHYVLSLFKESKFFIKKLDWM